MKFVDFLYLLLYGLLKFIAFILPNAALNALGKAMAHFAYCVNFKHRKIIKANLRLCFPEKNELWVKKTTLNTYKNFAQFGFDFLKHQAATKDDIKELVSIENIDILEKAIASKRVIVFITAHFGCWELIPFVYTSYFNSGISIVTRTLDSKIMNKFLIKNRTKHFDVELIDKVGGAKLMLKAIKNKRTLGILPDQDAGDNESMVLEFFGHKVNWNLGASVIAKKAQALLLPAFIYKIESENSSLKNGKNLDKKDENSSFKNDKNSTLQNTKAQYSVRFYEPLDAKSASKEELTIYQAKCVEDIIKFKPDEYFFFHKRFKRFYNEIYE